MERKKLMKVKERLFFLQTGAGLLLFFSFLTLLLLHPQNVQAGVAAGVNLCLHTLIPSMLPLLILSSFFQMSELGAAAARLLERPMQRLFGVPGAGAGVLLFAVLGGFPAGSANIRTCVEQQSLSRRDGQLLQLLCFCPSAAFTIGAVGGGMLGSAAAGFLLELSVLLPLPVLNLPLRLLRPPSAVPLPQKRSCLPAAQAFVNAVEHGAKTMLLVCAFVCLFSVLPPLLDLFPLPEKVRIWAAVLPELTAGIRDASQTLPLPALAGLLAVGGFCAHCQVLPTLRLLRLGYWKFFLFRLCHAGLSALVSLALYRFVPMQTMVFAAKSAAFAPSAASSLAVSVCLCCMCALLLGGDAVFKIRA